MIIQKRSKIRERKASRHLFPKPGAMAVLGECVDTLLVTTWCVLGVPVYSETKILLSFAVEGTRWN